MARKRKHRTHLKGGTANQALGSDANTPKSFVIKHGQVGRSLAQLVRDVRRVMEPNTASRLRERARNKLRDFLTMAPPLHVTHLLAFTLTDVAPSMRIIRLSNGPTLSFRVERYSLVKDILGARKHAKSVGMEYLTPPLLVLASFPQPGPGVPPHLPLLMKTFQSLFPPLSPKELKLSSARRVVLVSYNAERGTLDFRHYLITVKPLGVSRRVRKILEGPKGKSASEAQVLDLGSEKDIADFVLRRTEAGYESATSDASSAAGDEPDAAVSLADDYVGRNNSRGQRRAVRLDEIGPRMELRLVKIAEGVPGKEGAVIYHEFVKKTKAEILAQKKEHAEKERLRKQRREEQERNVEKKKTLAGEKKQRPERSVGNEGDEDEDEGAQSDRGDDDTEGDWDDQGGHGEEGGWDDDEVISEDEDTHGDESDDDSSESEPEVQERRPTKRAKIRSKR
ncbi:Brix-domain-containing protein [Punctularia strigosozonata HHB-11173 SS5]|uniref:Brix-domain-containing protein n=1 Tax=Punctularia strigosozonata (strain HHB-11173) TaxID=741275 RepID=UPI0004417786|nr:Brix-domain-containing protein [Punctularia strigosozonata HHB-11173 SS5]EIN07703.1 Brix-domain-containing protein [Punctularia strigosozonata HHB-11173 SS5]